MDKGARAFGKWCTTGGTDRRACQWFSTQPAATLRASRIALDESACTRTERIGPQI